MSRQPLKIKHFVKRSGEIKDFDFQHIEDSIKYAGRDTKAYDTKEAKKIAEAVYDILTGYPDNTILWDEVRDIVEPEIATAGHFQTAKYYILYGYEKRLLHPEVPIEIKQKFDQSKQHFRNNLAELVYYQNYARWDDQLGRRETWDETVGRFIAYMKQKLGDKYSAKDYADVEAAMINQQVVPSMRLFWASGDAVEENNIAAYNCSFITPTTFQDFGEIMYIMMSGTGLGFSVEDTIISQFPEVKPQSGTKLKPYLIADSKKGWADAFVHNMKTLYAGKDVEFDYSKIRPHGTRLKTMGGRAAGPEPLKSAIEFTRELILNRQGKQLTSLDMYDIICKIGEIVISGGVRRSSMISLSELNDEDMRHAKSGQFYIKHTQRVMANNSAIYNEKPDAVPFLEEWLSLAKSGSGERGIFNRGGLKDQLPARRWKTFEKHLSTSGTNPCGEIVLRSKQFCNLTAIVVRVDDTEKTLLEKIRIASILGTYQASLTDFPYLSKEWEQNSKEEALLGVSFTGYFDNPLARKPEMLEKMRDHAVKVNQKYAKKIGINPSTCVTCVKPSGNSSQLLDTASGMHPRYAPYYIRRVRINVTDPICQLLINQGVNYHPEVGQERETARTLVFEFPIAAPKGAITKDDVTAVELLEEWKKIKINFTEHNPSATIYVGDDEWLEVANWVYDNWDIVGGLTFLPRTDHVYQLAPYEEIDKKTYDTMVKSMHDIDFSQLYLYESQDNTTGAKELACVSGACEI